MSVLQTVRYQVERGLAGVLQWQHFVVRNFTAQMAVIDVTTPKGNKYELVARSASEAPPLGQVVLRVVHSKDAIEDVIEGQNQDRTWLQVCEFLKAKETGDSSDNAAAKARAIAEPIVPELAPDEIENPIPPVPFVYFIAQKGEFYRNGWAFVTSAHTDGTLDLTVFARNHESYHVERIAKRSEELRYHCFVDVSKPCQEVTGSGFPDDEALRRMIEAEVAKSLPRVLTVPPPQVFLANGEQLMARQGPIYVRAADQPVPVPNRPRAVVGGVSVDAIMSVGEKATAGLSSMSNGTTGDGAMNQGSGVAGQLIEEELAKMREAQLVAQTSAAFQRVADIGEKANAELQRDAGITPQLTGGPLSETDPVGDWATGALAADGKAQSASSQSGTEESKADPTNPNSDLANQFGDTAGMSAEDIEAMKQLARETGGENALAELEKQLAGSAPPPTMGA